jgi:hypothetical protein
MAVLFDERFDLGDLVTVQDGEVTFASFSCGTGLTQRSPARFDCGGRSTAGWSRAGLLRRPDVKFGRAG